MTDNTVIMLSILGVAILMICILVLAMRGYNAGTKKIDEAREELKNIVLDGRKEGKVVFFALDDLFSAPVSEFIKQPAEGILWDLNRCEVVALSRQNDQRWVNDFAVAVTITALKKRIAELEVDHEPSTIQESSSTPERD